MYEALEEDGEDGGAAEHVERGNGGPNPAPPLANVDAGIGGGIGGGGGGGFQKEGQSSDEEEYWECSLCLQPIVTNIWQCKKGHLMCGDCHVQSKEACPSCGTPMDGIRNRALERLRDRRLRKNKTAMEEKRELEVVKQQLALERARHRKDVDKKERERAKDAARDGGEKKKDKAKRNAVSDGVAGGSRQQVTFRNIALLFFMAVMIVAIVLAVIFMDHQNLQIESIISRFREPTEAAEGVYLAKGGAGGGVGGGETGRARVVATGDTSSVVDSPSKIRYVTLSTPESSASKNDGNTAATTASASPTPAASPATSTPPPAPAPPAAAEKAAAEKKAEEERIAAEKKAEEENAATAAKKKKAREKRIAAEKAEEERIAERAAAEKKAEEQRIAAEKAMEERIAEEKAREERIAAERAKEERIADEKAREERFAAKKAAAEKAEEEERIASPPAAPHAAPAAAADATSSAERESQAASSKQGQCPEKTPSSSHSGASSKGSTGVQSKQNPWRETVETPAFRPMPACNFSSGEILDLDWYWVVLADSMGFAFQGALGNQEQSDYGVWVCIYPEAIFNRPCTAPASETSQAVISHVGLGVASDLACLRYHEVEREFHFWGWNFGVGSVPPSNLQLVGRAITSTKYPVVCDMKQGDTVNLTWTHARHLQSTQRGFTGILPSSEQTPNIKRWACIAPHLMQTSAARQKNTPIADDKDRVCVKWTSNSNPNTVTYDLACMLFHEDVNEFRFWQWNSDRPASERVPFNRYYRPFSELKEVYGESKEVQVRRAREAREAKAEAKAKAAAEKEKEKGKGKAEKEKAAKG